jgi:hypothetical protein
MIDIKKLSDQEKDAYLEKVNKIMDLELKKAAQKLERADLQKELNEERARIDKRIDEYEYDILGLWEEIKTGQLNLELFDKDKEATEEEFPEEYPDSKGKS